METHTATLKMHETRFEEIGRLAGRVSIVEETLTKISGKSCIRKILCFTKQIHGTQTPICSTCTRQIVFQGKLEQRKPERENTHRGRLKGTPVAILSLFRSFGARPHSLLLPFPLFIAGDNVFVTTDHMGEPMPLNMVVQNLQVTLTEYNVKMSEQSKVRAFHSPRGTINPFLPLKK